MYVLLRRKVIASDLEYSWFIKELGTFLAPGFHCKAAYFSNGSVICNMLAQKTMQEKMEYGSSRVVMQVTIQNGWGYV